MEKIFLHIRFGLGFYITDAKNGIFAIFSAFAISKKVIISDISGRTLVCEINPLVLDKDILSLPLGRNPGLQAYR